MGEHIAGGSSQRALRQSAVQCILVHHAAPRRIDEQRAGLCRGKLRRTYKPARLRREGYADAHNVRPGKYLAYTSAAGYTQACRAFLCQRRRIPYNAHAERTAEHLCGTSGDAAHAHKAQRFAVQLHACQPCICYGEGFAGLQHAVRQIYPPRQSEGQSYDKLRHRLRVFARGIYHAHTALRCRSQVHSVRARAVYADDLQSRALLQKSCVHAQVSADGCVGPAQTGGVRKNLSPGFKQRQRAGMDGFTQKYFQHIASLDTVCGMFDALRSAQLLSFQASSLSAVA